MNAQGFLKRPFYQFLFNPGKGQLYTVLLLFVFSFLVTKITYFFYYPVWCTTCDIYSYSDPVIALVKHHLPVFDMRTPVYPMLLAFTYFTGFNLNAVLLLQMVISFLSCTIVVYIVFKYKKWFFLPFSILLLLFYSSGDFTAMDTNLSPTVLFADLMLVFAGCFIAALQSNKRSHFIITSLLFAAVILLRPQGLFLIGLLLAVCIIYYVNYRSTKILLPLLMPAALVYILLLSYNYCTFGKFKYSKFDTMSKLGYIINTIDVSPDYPDELNNRIKDYQQTIGGNCRDVICSPGFNFRALDTVYNNDRYSCCWAFLPFIKSNPDVVEKLIANSVKSCPQNAWKEFVVCFIRFYQTECKTNYFYFNELTNRKKYIEGPENFYDQPEKRADYSIIWRDWAKQVVDHKAGNYPILDPGPHFDQLRRQQPLIIRLINYYEVVFNLVFSNKIWLLFYVVSALIAAGLLLLNLFRLNKMDALLLLPFFPFLNSVLVSLIIPPIYYYIFPTRFFFMLSPFLVLFYVVNIWRMRKESTASAPVIS